MSVQASGEAQYTTDIPTFSDELAAAFVLTNQVSVFITMEVLLLLM